MALFNLQGSTSASMICNTTTAQYVLVMQDTTKGQVIVTTGITSLPLGVTMQSGSAGDTIPLQSEGVAKCTAKAAITLGDQVMPPPPRAGKSKPQRAPRLAPSASRSRPLARTATSSKCD